MSTAPPASSVLLADPVHVWLSTSPLNPLGVEAPTDIPLVAGSSRQVFIWMKPQTIYVDELFNPQTNPYKTLQNLSLNVIADSPGIDFVDGTFILYNPVLPGYLGRFQFLDDSTTGWTSTAACDGLTGICGLEGFSIGPLDAYAGIGGTGAVGDPFHHLDASGADAWLVGSLAVAPNAVSGNPGVNLQIGEHGLNHFNEDSAATRVRFGIDLGIDPLCDSEEPTYNAALDREGTLPCDDPDMTFQLVDASLVEERHWQGGSGMWGDPDNWSNGQIVPGFMHNVIIGANGPLPHVTVAGNQRANRTTVMAGRLHLDADGALASEVEIASDGVISGNGWIAGDLANRGDHAISGPDETLHVAGTADLAGAGLQLVDYAPPTGELVQVKFLEAFGGLTGTLAIGRGDAVDEGVFVANIAYGTHDVTVELLKPVSGDYNLDGQINHADYAAWSAAYGTVYPAADGNGDGLVDAADYTVWRDALAAAVGEIAGQASVPEPAGSCLCAMAVAGFLVARGRTRRRCGRISGEF